MARNLTQHSLLGLQMARPSPAKADDKTLLEVIERLLSNRRADQSLLGLSSLFQNALFNPYTAGLPTAAELQDEYGGEVAHDLIHFTRLEDIRSDVASLARFSQRVDFASFHLCAALSGTQAEVPWHGPSSRNFKAKSWYAYLVEGAFERYRVLRNVLIMEVLPSPENETLRSVAFLSLCDLTPASSQLRVLFDKDRARALNELTRHLDLVANQLEFTVKLAEDLAPGSAEQTAASDEARLTSIQADILSKAGDGLSLTDAAKRISTTRQNLHKRISTGSAIGVMLDSQLVVPSAQFVQTSDGWRIVSSLRNVLALFKKAEAGNWSALQFLVDPDPNLGTTPLDALRSGNVEAAVASARGFLGLDED